METRGHLKTRLDEDGLRGVRVRVARQSRQATRMRRFDELRDMPDSDTENDPYVEASESTACMQTAVTCSPSSAPISSLPLQPTLLEDLALPAQPTQPVLDSVDARREALRQWKEQRQLAERQKRAAPKKKPFVAAAVPPSKPLAAHDKTQSRVLPAVTLAEPRFEAPPSRALAAVAATTSTATARTATRPVASKSSVTVQASKPTTSHPVAAAPKPQPKASSTKQKPAPKPAPTVVPLAAPRKPRQPVSLASKPQQVPKATESKTNGIQKSDRAHESVEAVRKNLTSVFPSRIEVAASVIANLVDDLCFGSPETARIFTSADQATLPSSNIVIVSAGDDRTALDTPQQPTQASPFASRSSQIAPLPFTLPQIAESDEGDMLTGQDIASESLQQKSDGQIYRELMQEQKELLTKHADEWTTFQEANADAISEAVRGDIAAAIGKAHLICSSRFKQFAGLCDQSEDDTLARAPKGSDLQGFWELIMIQVRDVLTKFDALQAGRETSWAEVASKKRATKKMPTAEIAAQPTASAPGQKTPGRQAARDRFLKFKANQLKAKQEAEEVPAEPEVIVSTVSALTPMRVPKALRESLGSSLALTPCRRSTRKTPSGYKRSSMTSVTSLLESTNFAYLPNEAMENVEAPTVTTSAPAPQEEDDPLSKYLFGTPSKPDFELTSPAKSTVKRAPRTPSTGRSLARPETLLVTLTPARSAIRAISGAQAFDAAQRIPLAARFDDLDLLL
eukprot:m.386583 g.386583  ORF g.386583 m.386583 type:complete len:739 (-) comp56303_c0_seq1:111-2327(-)